MAKSRGALILIASFIGALFCLSGIVFTFQGLGIVGPTSSFMFQSQTWIYNGVGLLALGVIILGIALFFRARFRSSSKVVTRSAQQNPAGDQDTQSSA